MSRIGGHINIEKSSCLRNHAGDNQQAVCYPLDLRNSARQSGKQGVGMGENGEPAFCITGKYSHGVACFDNHLQDFRITELKNDCSNALKSNMGSGGQNVNFVVENVRPLVLDERKHAAPVTEDYVGSLCATDYKGSPVLLESVALQGSLIGRKSENGPVGKGYKTEQAYTVNTVDNGGAVAVCYQDKVGSLCASDWRGIRNQDIGEDKAIVETTGQTVCFGNNGIGKWNDEVATLKANGGDYPGGENLYVKKCGDAPPKYAVRRLTPLECLRLQGFPDYWLSDIHIDEPTAEELKYWRSAWEELGKKKTDNQLKKWLANPYSDTNEYKAIGNSLAVPCAIFALKGIAKKRD
jgi:DNA (cytosine-5)-methyltransferase 1